MGNHVVLLRRDASLAIALRALLGTDRVTEIASAEDWASLPKMRVDAVVADVAPGRRLYEVEEIRAHYRGRLVLVLDPGDDPAAVPPEHDCSVIKRPFEIVALWQLVTEGPAAPDAAEAGTPVAAKPGAPAKRRGAGERGSAPAAPAREQADRGDHEDRGDRDGVEQDRDRDRTAAKATWAWRSRRFRPRPTPTQAPPGAQPKVSTTQQPKEPPAAAAETPPAAAKAEPSPAKPQPAPASEVLAAAAKVQPAPAAKAAQGPPEAGAAQPEAAKARPTAPPAKAEPPAAIEQKAPPAAKAETPASTKVDEAAPPAATAKQPPAAEPKASPAARAEQPAAPGPGPVGEGEPGTPSRPADKEPRTVGMAGGLPRKAPTSPTARAAPAATTPSPVPGTATLSTPPPAGPSPLRRFARKLTGRKAADEGTAAPETPAARPDPGAHPVPSSARPAPPASQRPIPPAETPASRPAQPIAPARFRQTRAPEAQPPAPPVSPAQPASTPQPPPPAAGAPRPGPAAAAPPAAPPPAAAATTPPATPAAPKPPAPAKSPPAAEGGERAPQPPSDRPAPVTEARTGAGPQPAAPPPGRQPRPTTPPEPRPATGTAAQRTDHPAAPVEPKTPRPTQEPDRPAEATPREAPRPAAKDAAPEPTTMPAPAPSATGAAAAKGAPVPAAKGAAAAKQQPAGDTAARPSDQDRQSQRAWNLRRFTSSRRPETPEPQAPAARAASSGGGGRDRLSQSIENVTASLGGQSSDFYARDLPQIAASEIAKRVRADVIVLLLDNGQGIMEVSGEVGLTPSERHMRVEYSSAVMRELFRAGVGLVEDTDRVRGALAGIPGSRAETLLMVPLVHERLGFGVLMAGRGKGKNGTPAEVFADSDVEALMGFADGVAPSLRTAVLLRHLKGQLSALERG